MQVRAWASLDSCREGDVSAYGLGFRVEDLCTGRRGQAAAL